MGNENKSKLQEILEYVFEGKVRSYSGRGMYGRECLSVSGNSLTLGQVVSAIVEETDDDNRSEVAYAVEGMSWDNMGRGIVVYFPTVDYVGDSDESEEDSDETET